MFRGLPLWKSAADSAASSAGLLRCQLNRLSKTAARAVATTERRGCTPPPTKYLVNRTWSKKMQGQNEELLCGRAGELL